MKLITKLMLALVAMLVFTQLVPSLAHSEVAIRLEGFGKGDHPNFYLHSPYDIGPLSPSFGFKSVDTVSETIDTVAEYRPYMDITMSRYDETGSGYFFRIGSDFEDWNPSVAIGLNFQSADWFAFQPYYEYGYEAIGDELAYTEGYEGSVGVGVSMKFF